MFLGCWNIFGWCCLLRITAQFGRRLGSKFGRRDDFYHLVGQTNCRPLDRGEIKQIMLLTVLADGGSSRLGGVFQRGLRIFRQVIRGDKHPGPELEQGLARLPQNQLARIVPQTVGGNVFAVVRQGTKGILANYLARNQMQNLAAEMRRRYAVRLMSGSARFYSGLSNRIAIFSFVGISFGGIVHNQANQGQRDGFDPVEGVVQDLFRTEPEEKASYISNDEETELLVVRRVSISAESDITFVNEEEDFEDDFEIIKDDEELRLSSWPEESKIQTQPNAELAQELFQTNAVLREIVDSQSLEVDYLRKQLSDVLKIATAQRKELLTLRETVQNQNELFWTTLKELEVARMQSRGAKGAGLNPGLSSTPRNVNHASEHAAGAVAQSDIDMERLRAEGGRVRGLKIHRKKRMKNT